MNIQHLKTLIAIAERGTFVAAAESLNLTQSAVSMQIQALEDGLRTELFDRGKRSPVLNAHGRAVLERAREIVGLYDNLADAISDVDSLAGSLELGAIPTVLTGIAPKALAALQGRHSRIRINLVSGMSGDLLRRVDRGGLDAAIISEPGRVPGDLSWRPFASEGLIVLAPPEAKGEADAAVLSSLPYIRFNRRAWVARPIEEHLRKRGLKLRQVMELDSLEAITVMVNYGLGASIVPEQCVADPFPIPVRRLPFGQPQLHRRLGVVERAAPAKPKLTAALYRELLRLAGADGTVSSP